MPGLFVKFRVRRKSMIRVCLFYMARTSTGKLFSEDVPVYVLSLHLGLGLQARDMRVLNGGGGLIVRLIGKNRLAQVRYILENDPDDLEDFSLTSHAGTSEMFDLILELRKPTRGGLYNAIEIGAVNAVSIILRAKIYDYSDIRNARFYLYYGTHRSLSQEARQNIDALLSDIYYQ